jgi:hypothetical protein
MIGNLPDIAKLGIHSLIYDSPERIECAASGSLEGRDAPQRWDAARRLTDVKDGICTKLHL